MRKSIKTLAFIAALYAIPLAAQPALIADPRIVLLMAVCAVILLTQPELSLRGARRDAAADGYSVLAIMAGAAVSQVAPVIEWAKHTDREANVVWIAVGAAMLLGGTAFRVWAIRTLGRRFTATVSIQEGHKLIKTGPYRFVRHPSYLGAYVAMIGSTVLLEAPASMAITAVVMSVAYAYRIVLEERALQARFRNVSTS